MSGKQGEYPMSGGSGGDEKGGKGIDLNDFRLWKDFTRDIDPLEEPDWEALEALINKESPRDVIMKPDILMPTRTAPNQRESLKHAIKGPTQLDARTEARLRRGKLPIDGKLDLHGYRQEEAHALLNRFVTEAYRREKRCLLVITGKGKSTAGGAIFDVPDGVLKQKLPIWASLHPISELILKILPATQGHGGGGAFYIYLKRNRSAKD
jgi:DNA-nicking Smr family endonuclease